MSETVISIENVTLNFPKRRGLKALVIGLFKNNKHPHQALKGITLDIQKGEIVGIIGTNGCGKSTLLRVISGIYPPNSGTCKVRGNISLLAGLGTGFQPIKRGEKMQFCMAAFLDTLNKK